MMLQQEWVKLPTGWIKDTGVIQQFRWGSEGSANTAALMLLMPITHHVTQHPNDQFEESGQTDLPYRVLADAAGLSRAKVSAGLKVLEARGLISRTQSGRKVIYKLHRYNVAGEWAKLPARALYTSDLKTILPFKHFTLRNKNELNALKLYYLVLALRHNTENLARASYDTIHLYTHIPQNDIRGAISLLAAINMVHVEASPRVGELGYRNGYRPVGISPRIHAGTAGRREDFGDSNSFASAELPQSE